MFVLFCVFAVAVLLAQPQPQPHLPFSFAQGGESINQSEFKPFTSGHDSNTTALRLPFCKTSTRLYVLKTAHFCMVYGFRPF